LSVAGITYWLMRERDDRMAQLSKGEGSSGRSVA
jgi:hypothetical protein